MLEVMHVEQVNEGKKDFQCQICEQHLKIHVERVHEGKKDFQCQICEHHLKIHVERVHEGKKDQPQNSLITMEHMDKLKLRNAAV